MDASGALTEPEVRALAADLARDFEAARSLVDVVPASRFESHTSAFYELARPGGGEVVALIKVGRGWDVSEVRRMYDDLVALSGLLGAAGSSIRVAPALGWHRVPPSLCLGYVPGEDLGRLLRTSDVAAAAGLAPVIAACGEALGSFHSQSATSGLSVDAGAARAELESMARAVMVRPWFLDNIDLAGAIARRYGDFAPYNVRIDPDGEAWIIDQPSPPSLELVHRDVAWFLFNLERRLGWETGNRADFDGVRSDLVKAFHDGYRRTGPSPLDSPADGALLALYRAHRSLWTARRRLRQGQLSEVPAYLRLARQWRRAATG